MVRGQSVFKDIERKYLYHYGKKETGIVLCGSMPKYSGSSATVWYDYSPSGNHGTITGATWVRQDSGLYANQFDGDDDRIACGAAGGTLDITTGDFSYECWVKPGAAEVQYICSKRAGAVGYEVYISAADSLTVFIGDAVGFTTGAMQDLTTTWQHVLVNFDRDGNAYGWRNGVAFAATVDISSRTGTLSNATVFTVGKASSSLNGLQTLSRFYTELKTQVFATGHYNLERHLLGV